MCFCGCSSLLMGIVCQWPVLPSVFVCLRLFRRQFWKLNMISRKGFYALAKWVLTRRWKLNKLWLNKHAEPTMDSCDEWFSWQRLSAFFLTRRNAASSNGERAKVFLAFSHEKQTSGNGIQTEFCHFSLTNSEQILTLLPLSSLGRASVFLSPVTTWWKCTWFTSSDVWVFFWCILYTRITKNCNTE